NQDEDFYEVDADGGGVEEEDGGEGEADGEVGRVEDAIAILGEAGADEEVEIEARVETEEGDNDSAEDTVVGVELFMGRAEKIS
ncbi:hypothetical protein O988_09523, partial [Pseudogymnoascus sp. VKM F-3808]